MGGLAGVSAATIVTGSQSLHTCMSPVGTGPVECWGSNAYGQLGTGTLTNSAVAVAVTVRLGGACAPRWR